MFDRVRSWFQRTFDFLFDSGEQIMTNPNTPREDQVESLFQTAGTEQQETITEASAAIDRLNVIITGLQSSVAGLQANQVDDETLAEWSGKVDTAKQAADAAQAAFRAVGVPASPPAEPTEPPTEPDTPVARPRRR